MKLLHICSYYHGRPQLYDNFFHALEAVGSLDNEMYVPVHYGASMEAITPHPKILISPCYAKWNRVFFHLKHSRILQDIRKRLEIRQYDRLHAHTLFSNGYIAYRLNETEKIPYTVTVRNTDIYTFFKKMPHLRGLGRRILHNAGAVFFLSEAHRDALMKTYIPEENRASLLDKTYVIPNGIDHFWLTHVAPTRTLEDDRDFSVIYAGEVTRNKNIPALARAIEKLNQEGRTGSLTVVGNVVDRGEVRKLSAFPFVTLLPRMPKEELREQYRAHDLFALVSRRETFGLVCAEAMSQGLPVIYTRGQGFDRQFAEGEIGFPVDPGDTEEIADAFRHALREYDALSARSVALCSKFDWNKVAEAYRAAFLSLGDL